MVIADMHPGISNIGTFAFSSKVDAPLFDPKITNQGAVSNYSTCGWQRTTGGQNVTLREPSGPVSAYGSVKPGQITIGAAYYSFTYYIQAKTNFTSPIKQAAIEIPYMFTNCAISNIDSVLLGANESGNVFVTNGIPGISSNCILIYYTNESASFNPGGLDVISFEVWGTPLENTTGTNMRSWVDKTTPTSQALSNGTTLTNETYKNQIVKVMPALIVNPWDFMVISAGNTAPVSLGISNIVPMGYFEVRRDGEGVTEEMLSTTICLEGNYTDLRGQLYLYRDTNGLRTNFTTNEMLVKMLNISTTSATNVFNAFTVPETNQSINPLSPTRYWLAMQITNTASAIYSDTVRIRVNDITVTGPGPGPTLVENAGSITTGDLRISRVDTHQLYVYYYTNTTEERVKQGSFNNLQFRMVISNNDPDATNYFQGFVLTNSGTASNTDVGYLKLFYDQDNDGLEVGADPSIMAGSISGGKLYSLSVFPAFEIVNTTAKTFYGVYDTELNGTVGSTVALKVLAASNLIFGDPYGDEHSPAAPVIIGTFPMGNIPATNRLIPYTSRPFDYSLYGLTYSMMPASFSSNQGVVAGSFDIFMDTEETNIQVFKGVDVKVGTITSKANVYGYAYLYKETNGNGTFSAADQFIASNAVAAGADFSINCDFTNVSSDQYTPDRFYLLFRLTNNVEDAKTNTVWFQMTNMRCQGPDLGAFTNLYLLTNAFSRTARIDNGRVVVNYISNEQVPLNPLQSSFNNRYLKISLSGDDPDGTNYLSYIDVTTNRYASNLSFALGHIPYIKLLSHPSYNMLSYNSFTNGQTRISFSVPLAVSGTNETVLYVGYDVSGSELVISNTFGLLLTNGSIGLTDGIDDNYAQYSYIAGSSSGPSTTNYVTIKSFLNNPWDFYIVNGGNNFGIPASMAVSNIYPIASVDLIADVFEDLFAQRITNVDVRLGGFCSNVQGEIYLYRETNAIDGFQTNEKFLAKTNFTNPNLPISLSLNENNLSGVQLNPTRLWAALRVTNSAAAGLYTNLVNGYISMIHGIGPDGPTNAIVTNVLKFTNSYNPTIASRMDNYRVGVYAASMESNNAPAVQAGYINNMKVLVLSDDPDATNFLSTIAVSNTGTATMGDLGALRVFHDIDGDGVFNSTNDASVGFANFDATKNALVSLGTLYPMTGRTNTFFVGCEIKFSGTPTATIGMQLTNAIRSLTFADGLGGLYPTNATATNAAGASPLAGSVSNHRITLLAAYPFDFYLKDATNNYMPESFGTNQKVVAEYIRIYGDNDTNDADAFTGVAVRTFTSTISSNVDGIAYLYRESTNTSLESTRYDAGDILVGWTNVIAGGSFDIRCTIADGTPDQINNSNTFLGDKFYLVFELTNTIALSKNDRIGFQITNLYYTGSTNVFENTNALFDYQSKVMRIDSYNVVVTVMTNDFIDASVYGSSDKNPYIAFTLAGDDNDATNYLRYVDVKRNAAAPDANVPTTVYLATNKISGKLGTTLAAIDFNDAGVTLDLADSPIVLSGTNAVTVFVGYNVGAMIGKRLGLEIAPAGANPAAIRFVDRINDGHTQLGFATGMTNGPLPYTNIIVVDPAAEFWDQYIYQVYPQSNVQAISNVQVALAAFDMYREAEGANVETVYGITVTNLTTNVPFTGYIRIYTNTTASFDYSTGVAISTNYFISNDNAVVTILFPAITNSVRPTADRYFVTFTPLTFNDAARPELRIVRVSASGPNGGIVERSSLFSTYPVYPISLDNNAVIASVSSLLSTYVKQGQNGIAAMRITMRANDNDAVFSVNGFTLALEGSNATSFAAAMATNDIGNVSTYLDTGTSPGSFDAADSLVPGGFSIAADNKIRILFETPVALSNVDRPFLIVLKMHDNATIRDRFRLVLRRSEQTGLAALNIQGQQYALTLNDYSPDATSETTILPGIVMEANAISAATKTLFNPERGERFIVYLREDTRSEDLPRYKLHIYTAMGHKIGDYAFTAEFKSAEWNGTMGGVKAPSGLYLGIITGPNGYNKKVKVIVKK